MQNAPVFHLALSLAMSFSLLAQPAMAQDAGDQAVEESLEVIQAPASEEETPKTPPAREKDPLVLRLEGLDWEAVPDGARVLSFEEVLERTVKDNPDIELAREKINETEAKQDSVESKRVLFFFKYFNSDYIEGAAESDVKAAAKHVDVETSEALKRPPSTTTIWFVRRWPVT